MFLDTKELNNGEIFLRLDRTADAVPEKNLVPAYYFTICLQKNGEEAGTCDLRIGDTEKLFFGGNIGYAVKPEYRGHHYAAQACRLLFHLAKRHGMDHLYISCNPDNLPSKRTCELLGGELLCTIALPTDNDMYRYDHETHKCIFRFSLK